MSALLELLDIDPHSNSNAELHKKAAELDASDIVALVRKLELLACENEALRAENERLRMVEAEFERLARQIRLVCARHSANRARLTRMSKN